jgi:pyruvate dehydrogenase E2 component (dihydrolipoamide acetyltransferase)
MVQPIAMPKFGQTAEEATIVVWRKKEGDKVAKGDILLEIETDKAQLEVESYFDGTLLKIHFQAGATVPVGHPVGYIGNPGESAPAPAPIPQKSAVVAKAAESSASPRAPRPQAAARVVSAAAAQPAPAEAEGLPPVRRRLSPRAAKLARECVIDASSVTGSGPNGRVLERDVKTYLESKGYSKLRISPAARELAAGEQVDILSVKCSEGGAISVDDVKRAVAEKPRKMSRLRQVIAQRILQSVTTAPHFFVTVAVDMTDLLALRQALKAASRNLTVNDFILKALAMTLTEFPDVNSATDGETVRWRSRVHLGLATAIESGLVVPVLWNADAMNLDQLHAAAADLAERARAGKLTPDEMAGSTFTLSNMGMMDVDEFTAIINPGESAILAVASARQMPVVRDGQVVVRSIMKMTLSADHRIIDGAFGARFINAIKDKLEDDDLWKRLTS